MPLTDGIEATSPDGRRLERAPRFDALVRDMRWEAEGVLSITLVDPAGEPLPAWRPGAHIDLLLTSGLERQYSLCGDLTDRFRWRVAVLRETESRGGSEWVHGRLRPGAILSVCGPRNNFRLVEAGAYVFIAGGIGITPILPMIAAVDERGANWELVYGGRRRASMAFLPELARYGSRVLLWPQDEHGLLDLDRLLHLPREDTAVYCCGPEPLISAVEERCTRWPPGTLHFERFRPRPDALKGENTAFEVVLEQSGVTVFVGPDQTIAEAVDAAGISVPTSCREGTCGTCETGVVEGIPDHRDSFLSDEEHADNTTMMICCSRAATPRLVLDL
jgi:ferredoxin-NADP reductase